MSPIDATLHAFALLFTGDSGLWRLVWVSLATGMAGLLLATPPALLLGYLMAMHAFRGRRVVVWLVQASLSVPTVLIGLLLVLLLSEHGPLRDLGWLLSRPGMVLGAALVALPVLLAFALAALQAVDPRHAETALALGARRRHVMARVLHEARFGLLAALLGGFGRVIAEAGCALVVGGNIAGRTRSLGTAIARAADQGDAVQGIALGVVLVAIALLVNAALLPLQGAARVGREHA